MGTIEEDMLTSAQREAEAIYRLTPRLAHRPSVDAFVAGARWGMIRQLRDRSASLRSAWQQWGDSNDLTQAEAIDARADALIEEQERSEAQS